MEFLNGHYKDLYEYWVKSQESARMGEVTTVVCLKMINGYEVVGTSTCDCEDSASYDYESGVVYAICNALDKIDNIVSYLEYEHALEKGIESEEDKTN